MFLSELKLIFLIVLHFCCATDLVEGKSRVIGGQDVSIYTAPYQVSLRYKSNTTDSYIHRCAGTIYSTQVILTTATCVHNVNLQQLHVIAGETHRSGSKGSVYLVNRIILHPEFDVWFMDNDLALVLLAHQLTVDGLKINSIGIAPMEPTDASEATVAGWGAINSEESAETLQLAQLLTVDVSKCRLLYGEQRITPAMLCAGRYRSNQPADACIGDAGGALVVNGLAVGLVSWGRAGCGLTDYPGVYTNLVYLREWIQEESANIDTFRGFL